MGGSYVITIRALYETVNTKKHAFHLMGIVLVYEDRLLTWTGLEILIIEVRGSLNEEICLNIVT